MKYFLPTGAFQPFQQDTPMAFPHSTYSSEMLASHFFQKQESQSIHQFLLSLQLLANFAAFLD